MDQFDGFTLCGNEIKPASSGQEVRLEVEDAGGDGIEILKAVKEPAGQVEIPECLLDATDEIIHSGHLLVTPLDPPSDGFR